MSTNEELFNIVSGLSDEKRGILLTFARFLREDDSCDEATREIEADSEMMRNLRIAEHEISSGKTQSWESVR